MRISAVTPYGLVMMIVGLCLAGLASGCQRSLFADSDASVPYKVHRYYNDDSAVETTESRRKSSEWGFGFPMMGGGGSSN